MSESRGLLMFNAVRSAMPTYADRIPEATRNNIAAVGNAFSTFKVAMNEWVDTLVNKIGLELIENFRFGNKAARFEKGRLEAGDTIQDDYIEVLTAMPAVVPTAGESVDQYEQMPPSVNVGFHRIDRRMVYGVTIWRDWAREAFHDVNKLDEFERKVLEVPYQSLNLDKWIMFKELLGSKNIYPTTGESPTKADNAIEVGVADSAGTALDQKATAENLIEAIKNAAKYATQTVSTDNNRAKVLSSTPPDRLVLFLRMDWATVIDFRVLTGLFNLDEARLGVPTIIEVEDFGSSAFMPNQVALLADEWAFKIYSTLDGETDTTYNARGRYWNYFIHYWGMMSYSLWGQAIPFTATPPAGA